jgi:chemotaxis signal transduction protein
MLNKDNKHLKFRCGTYELLINISYILEISEYKTNKNVENDSIFFIDMRSALGIDTIKTIPPTHKLLLKKSCDDKPFIYIAIDEVHEIIEIQDHEWYELNGIHPELDLFFDRAYPDKHSGEILMRLAPTEQWATENMRVAHAY